MHPSVSVITPVYNTAAYLEKCLGSLIRQTLPGIELIWVDNGADEQCRRILQQHQNLRPGIKVIHLPENRGYSGAMNAGLEQASGKYVGFVDSDDWVDDDYFEELYRCAEENGCDIVYTNYQTVSDGQCRLFPHRTGEKSVSGLRPQIETLKNGAVWDKIYRRSIIEQHHLRFSADRGSYFQDNVFLLQTVFYASGMRLTEKPYYWYRQNPASLMHNAEDDLPRLTYALTVIKYLLDHAAAKKFSADETASLLQFLNRSLPVYSLLGHPELRKKLFTLLTPFQSFVKELENSRIALYPSLAERFFSACRHNGRKVVRFLGLTFKITQMSK